MFRFLAQLLSQFHPIVRCIPHSHSWRLLTKADYGSFGKHWGNYHGVEKEECVSCGLMREVPYEVTCLREKTEKENAVRNLTPERLDYWKRYSRTSEGPIMIGDGGSVRMLEYGTPRNGGAIVLEKGNDKLQGPKIIFRGGEEVTANDLRGNAPANPIGQAHLDASHAKMRQGR